jgi:hypothetical protein
MQAKFTIPRLRQLKISQMPLRSFISMTKVFPLKKLPPFIKPVIVLFIHTEERDLLFLCSKQWLAASLLWSPQAVRRMIL